MTQLIRNMAIKDMFDLQHKVIVLTGGSGHLGSSMTKALVEFGAKVVVADIIEKDPDVILGKRELNERLKVIKCDLSSASSIQQMFKKAREIFGKIDVLINCAAFGGGAGMKKIPNYTFDQIPDDIWTTGIDGSLSLTFRCIREVLPYFYENGSGTIVNIASMYGIVSPDPEIYGSSGQNSPPMYGAGKAAVLQLTRYCAAHLSKRNIRVNSITPGPFPRPEVDEEFKKRLNEKTMLGRTGKPEELSGALILLVSDASSYMTGTNIVVDGGWTAW